MTALRRCAATAGLAAALFVPAAIAGAVSSPGPDGQITNVQTTKDTLQFVLSVGNLPDGATLDPTSVVVTAGNRTLDASVGQADTAVAKTAAPLREAVLALDVSGSMAGDGIAGARSAALSYAQSMPSDVRIGLVTFSDRPHVLLRPTTDRAALDAAIRKVQAGGNTALYDGIITAAGLLHGLPGNAERRLLILSDGADTVSTASLSDAEHQLRADQIPADVVAFRLPGNQSALASIAGASKGQVLPAGSAADLAGAFKQAASVFRQELLVTVAVPAELAGKQEVLTASVNAGSSSISAIKTVTFPSPTGASDAIPRPISAPAASSSTSKLQLMLALIAAFIAIAGISGVFLFVPVLSHARAERESRLAETHRYRVVGAVGAPNISLAPVPVKPGSQSALAERALAVVDRTVRARGQRDRIVGELEKAGMRLRPEEWAVIQFAVVLGVAVLFLLVTGSILGLLVGGILGFLGVRAFIRMKISRRQNKFMDQLPDTLQQLASSLRTGFSLNQALGGVVREGSEPTASEFARALTEVRIGSDLEAALDDTALRMECEDLHWVVMAVQISREVGGNLAEVLGTTVSTMRQRAELRGQVRVLSAEGRLSARILTALPFVVGGALALLRPHYLTPLFHTGAGIALICVGAVLLVLGTLWLRSLVKIKV